jgi:hypothetical protein
MTFDFERTRKEVVVAYIKVPSLEWAEGNLSQDIRPPRYESGTHE